jgi:hypothetical protein
MKTRIITFVGILLLATSCIGEKPKTEVVKEDRNLSGFNAIHTNSSIDVIISQGDKESVIVETNKEYQEQVIITVEGNKLIIEVKGNIFNPDKFNVYVTVVNLNEVKSSGSGDIETVGILKFPKMAINSNGSGDLELNLESKIVKISNQGSGDVELKGKVEDLNISSLGSGDLEISSIDFKKLAASVQGSGDLEISGSAESFNFATGGSGDLEGEKFKVKEFNGSSMGSGDIKIAVEEIASVNLAGSGGCKIIGNPETKNLKSTGSGDFY